MMEQAVHILRKDVRHLWPRVLIVLLLTAAHAVVEVRSLPVYLPETKLANTLLNLLVMLLPLGMWFLIAWLVFQEALPGDRQFWLSRPYRWPELLASKVLFILTFINIPLLISDCYILGAQHFPVFSVFRDLLLRQFFLTALFIVPFFAIATVTAGISQFLVAWFVLILAFVCEGILASVWGRGNGGGFLAVDVSIFLVVSLAVACGVVIWQYATRRTTVARLVLFAIACALLPSILGLPSLVSFRSIAPAPTRLPDQPSVRIAYDPDRTLPSGASWQTPNEGFVLVRIPLSVAGLPPQTLLRGSARITIKAGEIAWQEPEAVTIGSVERIGDDYWQTMNLRTSRLDILKRQPSNLHASLDLEIVGDEVEQRESLTRHSFFVPALGFCHILDTAISNLTCRAGLGKSTETSVRLDTHLTPGRVLATFTPQSIPWGLSPTSDLGTVGFSDAEPGAQLAFIPRRKIAEFQRTLNLPNFQLAKYMLPR